MSIYISIYLVQPRSPTSRKEAAREIRSPVFDYRLIQETTADSKE